jgi:hypothetical protein
MTKHLIPIAFAAALAPLALAGPAAAQQNCPKMGAPVALTGMVSSLQASGPPGYGQTPKTDSVVQVPILQMSPPLCVAAAGSAQQSVNAVQLVFQPQGPQFQTEMTGTSFMVSGTLAPAQGPQHITPVVLMVQNMEQVMTPVETAPPQAQEAPPAGPQPPRAAPPSAPPMPSRPAPSTY